jgi:hypothetical protein
MLRGVPQGFEVTLGALDMHFDGPVFRFGPIGKFQSKVIDLGHPKFRYQTIIAFEFRLMITLAPSGLK